MKKVVEKSSCTIHTPQVQGQLLRRWSEEGGAGAGVRRKERKGKRGQIGGGAVVGGKVPRVFLLGEVRLEPAA